ncbi:MULTISPECIES: hypothetical protein [unclassified Burkholderia]|uniref:hypothetical protein n=1 Tax=unclassified Burkholderia TaxID=2613784 RepID=UPI0019622E12|nr:MULTISPECIES: hypothetical protein [unclassified Burkholderia]
MDPGIAGDIAAQVAARHHGGPIWRRRRWRMCMTGMPRLAGRRSRWLVGQCTRGERQGKHHARGGEQQVAWHGSGSLQAVIAACFT